MFRKPGRIFFLFVVLACVLPTSVRADYQDSVEKIHYLDIGRNDLVTKQTGSSNPKLEVYMWVDLAERYSRMYLNQTLPALVNEFGNRAQFTFRYRTIIGTDKSLQASVAAECVAQQGKFWENVTAVSNNSDNPGNYSYLVGIDNAKFSNCLKDLNVRNAVQTSEADGKYFGFNAVPTTIIKNLTASSNAYSVKVAGAMELPIFERAFSEAENGDLTEQRLSNLENKVQNLQQQTNSVGENVTQTQSQVQQVVQKQSFLEEQIANIQEILQRILQKLGL